MNSAIILIHAKPALAKELGKLTSPQRDFELVITTEPAGPLDSADARRPDEGIVLNKTFHMTVQLQRYSETTPAPNVSQLTFDARMPAHRHGMVTKPKITQSTPDSFRIEGVKLHMAGSWDLSWSVMAGEHPVRWSIPIQVK